MKIKPMLFGIIASGGAVVGAQSAAANTWGITFAAPLNSGTQIGVLGQREATIYRALVALPSSSSHAK